MVMDFSCYSYSIYAGRQQKEGYGSSNDAQASFGASSFSAASFLYDWQTLELTINLNYWARIAKPVDWGLSNTDDHAG